VFRINPPAKAKYKPLLMGLDVMAHEPVLHPTKYQYANPAKAPTTAPIIVNLYLVMNPFIKQRYKH